ncbi:MAG TPA: TldD/PmbA family protein, partial [Spirochaetes bacterium]|nr:TldD/PmbA family protein [Spirochaetota bacterium]
DDASHPLSAGLPFDFEGMPREKVTLIEKGVFKDMVLDRRLAQDLNKTSTGHSLPQPNSYGPLPLNLIIEPGDQSMEDMIASTDHGLFVNRFHYTNLLDPMTLNLTGMTRDGLFLIQHGKITQPVRNFRFTESLVKAFNELEAIGDRSTYIRSFFGGGFVVPGLKINRFHFSSKTDF